MKKLPVTYPKDISGIVTFSPDSSLGLDRIDISYFTTVNSKNERMVSSVMVFFPEREGIKTNEFCDGRLSLELGKDDTVVSLTFNSISDLVNLETGEFLFKTPLEEYAEATQDVELLIFIQVGLQFWGVLMDMFKLVNIYGTLVKTTVLASEGHEVDLPDSIKDLLDNEDTENDI